MNVEAGKGSFAFQNGSWTVRHRKLRERLSGCTDWYAFDGTCEAWELWDGSCNVDDHWLDDPQGQYAAATFRRLEPNGNWSIWWIDPRLPKLASPMLGRFENGQGTFYGAEELRGSPVKARFIWSHAGGTQPQWQQAFSGDDGRTWETNWIMDFERRLA